MHFSWSKTITAKTHITFKNSTDEQNYAIQFSVFNNYITVACMLPSTHLYLNQYQFKLKNQQCPWNPLRFTWKINLVKNDIFHTKQMNREEFSVQPYKWYVFLQLCDHFVSCVVANDIFYCISITLTIVSGDNLLFTICICFQW